MIWQFNNELRSLKEGRGWTEADSPGCDSSSYLRILSGCVLSALV